MEANPIFELLPSLIETALDSRHSLDIISVSSEEESVKVNLIQKDGAKFELEMGKN